MPTGDEIRAAYALLGLVPGAATLVSARRQWRTLVKVHHPDYHPTDRKTATAKTAAINEAYALVVAHLRAGGRLEADADGDAPRRAGRRITIYEVVAPAGAGKTTRWATAMQRSTEQPLYRRGTFQWPPGFPRHMIYAGPTIKLLEEVASALAKVGVKPTIIHTRPGAPFVNVQLARYFAEIKTSDDVVLLISHAALFNLPHTLLKKKRKPTDPDQIVFDRTEWDLVIDEAPDVLTFYSEYWPLTHRLVSDRVAAVEYSKYLYQLIPHTEAAARYFKTLGSDIPHDTNIGDGVREIARALVNPYRLVLVAKPQWDELAWRDPAGHSLNPYFQMVYQGAVDVAVLTTPVTIADYRTTTIMGARLPSTMYHALWQKLYNVEYRTHPLQERLAQTHNNGRRLRLWYLVSEQATRDLLQRKSEDGTTMFRSMADRIGRFFGQTKGPLAKRNRQFIWSAPLDRGSIHGIRDTFFRETGTKRKTSSRPGSQPFDPDLRLSGRAMGLNFYMKYHNAVLLNVVNFSPNQYTMLHSLGLKDAEIYRAHTHNIAYQDLLRCSIRRNDIRGIVNGVVIDKATALDIAGDFPGCNVDQMSDAPKRAKPKKPGPKPTGTAKDNAQRQRQYRARQRTARQAAKERQDE